MTRVAAVFCLLELFSLIVCGRGATEHSVEVYIPCDNSCNNGLCDHSTGTCICYPFYTGEHCDRALLRPCGGYYCFNEGTCQVNASGREYCQCHEGYTGEYCLTNGTFCLNSSNCSVCVNFTASNCSDSYASQCATDNMDRREECGSCYCFNGGTCQNGTCVCAEGFGGEFCQHGCANINKASQSCGRHFCYYGGECLNNTCHCPSNSSGVYCEYVHAPSGQLSLEVTGYTTSAVLTWQHPVGYEGIASSGGVRYMVSVQNLATGRTANVQASGTTVTQTLVHSTEYCFRVRAEVSGGVGDYSERKCYTTPGAGFLSAWTIATPAAAAALSLIVLAALALCAISSYWRIKRQRAKRKVESAELKDLEVTKTDICQLEGMTTITAAPEYDTVIDAIHEYDNPGTENQYQEISDAIDEMNQSKAMNGEVTANADTNAVVTAISPVTADVNGGVMVDSSVKADLNGGVMANPVKQMNSHSDAENAAIDLYEEMVSDGVNIDPFNKADDVVSISSELYI